MAKSQKQKSSKGKNKSGYKAPKQGDGQFAPTDAQPVRQHYKMATEGLK